MKEKTPQPSVDDQQFLKQVKEKARQQIADGRVEIAALAADLCMSLTAFRRRFTAITGETPQAYIFKMRMEKARTMIDRHQAKTIADVAMLMGFDDKSNFTRAFRKAFGITPSEYKYKKN